MTQEIAKWAEEVRICKGSSIYPPLKEAKVAGLIADIRRGKETVNYVTKKPEE
jgi:hypothetical protein